jgi:putative endonuclease
VPWLVMVEVRTRRGLRYGSARESVTLQKQAKLREVGAAYVQATGWEGPWRIDVVAVQMDANGRLLAVEHIRHAVTG